MGIGISPSKNKSKIVDHLSFLRNVPLFTTLDDKLLSRIYQDFRVRQFNRDEVLFRQDDTSRQFYIVVKGSVRVFKVSPSGGETSISVFFERDIVGEFATIDAKPRSATAKTLGKAVLLEMHHADFLQHMRDLPDLSLRMCQLLCEKVRWTASYAETISQFDAAGRLLHMLLLYKDQHGIEIEPGKRYQLNLSLNQTDLASLIGARREWVNRLLTDWRKRELIEHRAGKITILDLPAVVAERDSRIEANL